MPTEAMCLYCEKEFKTFRAAQLHEKSCRHNPNNKSDLSQPQPQQSLFTTETTTVSKPVLIRCGTHLINPLDVSRVCEVKRGVYVIDRKSNPNPEYKIWVHGSDINALIEYFNVRG